MMISRGLFGWSPPHIQPLTPVSEVSEPPKSPSPYLDTTVEEAAAPAQVEAEEEMEEDEELEPPAAVPFSRLFACADRLDWALMIVGSIAAAAHGTALVVYLHYCAKIVHVLGIGSSLSEPERFQVQFERFTEHATKKVYFRSLREREIHDKNNDGFVSFFEYEAPTWVKNGIITKQQTSMICAFLSDKGEVLTYHVPFDRDIVSTNIPHVRIYSRIKKW